MFKAILLDREGNFVAQLSVSDPEVSCLALGVDVDEVGDDYRRFAHEVDLVAPDGLVKVFVEA